MVLRVDVHVERDPKPRAMVVGDPVRLVDVVVRELVLRLPATPAERPHVHGVGAGPDRGAHHLETTSWRQELGHPA
jgi:hypothetical protein